MFVDSHCHINFPELSNQLSDIFALMTQNKVSHALCVSVNLEDFPQILDLAVKYPHIYASIGVHPDYEDIQEPSIDQLVDIATHPKIIAIGETGLDYFRLTGDLEWQRQRFRNHIQAARRSGKPLIIHTREAAEDTLKIMREEKANETGGVMHCFTENWDVAKAAIDLNFYISFSGIVTFKNAVALKEVAQKVPLEKMLIETDSPYLAPVPFRGKTNQPAYVMHVAEEIAKLKNVSVEEVGKITTENFFSLFKIH
jgi:TatD DNase family protein